MPDESCSYSGLVHEPEGGTFQCVPLISRLHDIYISVFACDSCVNLPCAEVTTSYKIWPLKGKDALVSQARPNQSQRGSMTLACVLLKAISVLWLVGSGYETTETGE